MFWQTLTNWSPQNLAAGKNVIRNFLVILKLLLLLRFVQEVLKDCPQSVFLRVVKWIEDNLDTVIESRPTVFVALSVIDQIVTSSNEDESWRILLEKLMLSLVKTDRVKVLFISNNS